MAVIILEHRCSRRQAEGTEDPPPPVAARVPAPFLAISSNLLVKFYRAVSSRAFYADTAMTSSKSRRAATCSEPAVRDLLEVIRVSAEGSARETSQAEWRTLPEFSSAPGAEL